MSFGVTSTGFVAKRLEDIRSEIESDLRDALGKGINLDPRSPLGQIVGIFAERESTVWELAEAVYNSQYPDTAEGVHLERAVSFTGTTKKKALNSTVTGKGLGTFGTNVPAGTVISVEGNPDARFVTDTAFTIDQAAVDEVQGIAFDVVPDAGDWTLKFTPWDESTAQETASLAYNAPAADVQAALRALDGLTDVTVTGSYATGFVVTFTGVDGETRQKLLTVGTNNLTNTGAAVAVDITETTEGTEAWGEVALTSEEKGAIQAPAGSLTVIETPVSGLDSFTNPLDAEEGRSVESDSELRLRREQELQLSGAATIDAIRSQLSAIEAVTAVLVFYNADAVTDIEGRPPHSLDIVVEGGITQDIADKIWSVVAGGIKTIGDISATVTDSQGFSQTVRFSRPTEVQVYVEIDVTTDPNTFPSDGSTKIQNNIVAYGDSLEIGDDVIVYPDLIAALSDEPNLGISKIPGITDVTIRIGKTAGPVNDSNITIAARERAKFDTSRVIVAVT